MGRIKDKKDTTVLPKTKFKFYINRPKKAFEPNSTPKHAWLQPYKAPFLVHSGSYAITTVQSPNAFLTFLKYFSKKLSHTCEVGEVLSRVLDFNTYMKEKGGD